jgi:hypothetical protein
MHRKVELLTAPSFVTNVLRAVLHTAVNTGNFSVMKLGKIRLPVQNFG